MSVGEQLDLQPWAALIVRGMSHRGGANKVHEKGKECLEEMRSQLSKGLLEVGMSYSLAVTGINSGTVLSGSVVRTGFAPVQHLPNFH